MSSEKDHFEELRRLILESDRESNAQNIEEILEKLNTLEENINDPEMFAEIIQKSKSEIIDVLGPQMGKMIKKYIASEINKLKQGIEKKSKAFFSFKFFRKRFKNKVTGVSDGDALINEATGCNLEQIFVIEKNSGLLIGEYSHQSVLEPEMVAGMLSAIKSFVESAFGIENSELESLEYSNYKILLYNFNRFYFACVLDGYVDANIKSELQDDFLNLVDKKLGVISLKIIDEKLKKKVEQELENTFNNKYLNA